LGRNNPRHQYTLVANWLCRKGPGDPGGHQADHECTIIGSVQGQVAWSFEQLDLVKGIPAHGRRVRLDDLKSYLPTQTILWFCHPMSQQRALAAKRPPAYWAALGRALPACQGR